MYTVAYSLISVQLRTLQGGKVAPDKSGQKERVNLLQILHAKFSYDRFENLRIFDPIDAFYCRIP